MSTGAIGRPTFGGLASGLDTNALLSGLLEIERLPLNRLESRRSEIANQRSLMRDLNSKIIALRDAARELDNRNSSGTDNAVNEEFLRYEGSSSNEDVITVTAGAGASPGDIDVVVKSLATNSRRFSETYASADTVVLAEGETMTISLPNGDPDAIPDPIEDTLIEITGGVGGTTLQNLRDQINTSPDNGSTVRADVFQVSEDEFRLVLTSVGTGPSNNMSVSGGITLDPGQNNELVQNAQPAILEVFGQEVTRESNAIDDVLPGITLRLVGSPEEEDDLGDPIPEAATVTVGVDVEEIAKAVEKFTKAYNDVVSFIDKQFSYNESTETSGPLSGDSTLRSIQSRLQRIVSRGYSFEANPNNPFAPSADGSRGGAISGIGIEVGSGGRLSVNREKLEEALALDPLSVTQFLRGNVRQTAANQDEIDLDPTVEPDLYDEGFAQLVATELEAIVRSGDGELAERDNAYARRLRSFDDSITRFEQRLASREESLIQRFSALESLVAGLQGQQGFLAGIG